MYLYFSFLKQEKLNVIFLMTDNLTKFVLQRTKYTYTMVLSFMKSLKFVFVSEKIFFTTKSL